MLYQYSDGQSTNIPLDANQIKERIRANPQGQHWIHQQGWTDWQDWRQVPEFQHTLQAISGKQPIQSFSLQTNHQPTQSFGLKGHFVNQHKKVTQSVGVLEAYASFITFILWVFGIMGIIFLLVNIERSSQNFKIAIKTSGIISFSIIFMIFMGLIVRAFVRGFATNIRSNFDTSVLSSPLTDAEKKEFFP